MTQQRDMLGRTTQFQYDALGRMTSRIGPDGVVTRYEYDAGGRLMAVVENYILNGPVDKETNVRTAFGYDNNGNQTTSTDARSNVTTQVYDSLDRRTRLTDPLNYTHFFTYTVRGELGKSRDALGRVTDYNYDNGGRLTTLDYPSSTPDVAYQYDKASNVLTMTDRLGATYYGYDPLNRMERRTRDGRAVHLHQHWRDR